MSGIFNQSIKAKFIQNFKTEITEGLSNYYITFGKFFNWPDDNTPPATNSAISEIHYNVNRNILFGKKLSGSDINFIVRKIQWVSGTVYDYYTDTDPDLYNKDFYIVTSLNRVYKCLFNNYGSPSTVEPNSTVNSGDITLADGYIWKYLYTIDSASYRKFATDSYIPVYQTPLVSEFAESGALHVMVVDNGGLGYQEANGSIDSVLDTKTFKISNTSTSIISGAYTNSTFYVYSGGGQGQLSPISDYVVNSTGKYVFTSTNIKNVDSTSRYRISPQVIITGDGTGAAAVTNVDPSLGSITSINVIDRGTNYSYANVQIVANTYFGTGASAHAVISSRDGHGYNAITELGSAILGISISTSISDNFPSWANYRQIALINNPVASANLSLYSEDDFNQMLILNVAGAPQLFNVGDTITGFNSKATATVVYMDQNVIYVINDSGIFQPYETVISQTGVTCVISIINNKDLVPFSADVFYYKNIEPISRVGVRSEDVKLYFNF